MPQEEAARAPATSRRLVMVVREVGTAEFHRLSRRSEGKLVVVKFTATWCGPCRRIAPQLEALAGRNPDVEFVKVSRVWDPITCIRSFVGSCRCGSEPAAWPRPGSSRVSLEMRFSASSEQEELTHAIGG